jgi:hypothetical protein
MGLLDDAIRDHLDLKRRRGADPDEIARLEHEALGPVRREPFEGEERESASDADGVEHSLVDERESELGDAEFEESDEGEYVEHEEPDRGEPFADDEAEHGSGRWRRFRRAPIPPEEAPPTQAAPPEIAEEGASGEETIEYGIDEARGSRQQRSEHRSASGKRPMDDEGDVLEETPEFLQDAPEHDRLWFEQRPPRDFDFDD